MKKNLFQTAFLLIFIIASPFSLKSQKWETWVFMTKDCRTCIKKNVSTYDKEKNKNIVPAILMDNAINPTILYLDSNIIYKNCKVIPFKVFFTDIYKYEILPGNHSIIGCLNPSLASKGNHYSSDGFAYNSLWTPQFITRPVSLEFNAEEGKTYRLGAIVYEDLGTWSLIVVDSSESVIASSIEPILEYIAEKINDKISSERIKAAGELDTLYKMSARFDTLYNMKSEEKRALNLLLSLSNDTNIDVRLHTIYRLSGINNDTIPPILETKYIESKDDEKLLLNSALILVKSSNYDENLIKESFRSQNYLVREITAKAIRTLGSIKYNESLINLLNDEYKSVRYEAAWTIGELGDISAIQSLKQFRKQETNWKVKRRIIQSIRMLNKLK